MPRIKTADAAPTPPASQRSSRRKHRARVAQAKQLSDSAISQNVSTGLEKDATAGLAANGPPQRNPVISRRHLAGDFAVVGFPRSPVKRRQTADRANTKATAPRSAARARLGPKTTWLRIGLRRSVRRVFDGRFRHSRIRRTVPRSRTRRDHAITGPDQSRGDCEQGFQKLVCHSTTACCQLLNPSLRFAPLRPIAQLVRAAGS